MALVVRHPTPEEDLAPFFDVEHCPLRWNLEQVYVADDGTRLVGIALIFDGGHDVVVVDYVRAVPPWEGKGVWLRLLRHIVVAMRAKGKVALIGYVGGAQAASIKGMALRDGAHLGTETYVALRKEL